MKVPVELRNEGSTLVLVWPDGVHQRVALNALRAACPCGYCRAPRLGGSQAREAFPADLLLTDIAPMGYGVQLVFSDGHDRGIYPWSWLENFQADALANVLTTLPDKETSSAAPWSMPH
ncbi:MULTISPECIES: DUF971 domain-containing protein [unclassified Paraburkholderia]|uniref:DUF971 domain-containing protein n=1 Tax=unclassified Paraburkholderia TaxID=2615204 RepID=UPI002AB15096|nr:MULTISPECIES: DUF971 domain-containing protein [unclassified Paraburkholderia]